jgi:hypothetical protein
MPTPLSESYREIPLTQGQVALVDAEDYEYLSQYTWFCFNTKTGLVYAARNSRQGRKKTRLILMHREIMGCVPRDGFDVDHEDHNTFDNRKSNLRKCAHRQNCCNKTRKKPNKSGFRGVYPAGKRWMALITIRCKQKYLGTCDTKEEAYALFCKAALEFNGDFALLD